MQFTKMNPPMNVLVLVVLSFFMLVGASSSAEKREPQDVFAPTIITPNNNTVWPAKSTQLVVWDVSNPPAQITNSVGQIRLVVNSLITPVILADNFSILLGNITVIVPWVTPGLYQIVLFGDSGDSSQLFSITAAA